MAALLFASSNMVYVVSLTKDSNLGSSIKDPIKSTLNKLTPTVSQEISSKSCEISKSRDCYF